LNNQEIEIKGALEVCYATRRQSAESAAMYRVRFASSTLYVTPHLVDRPDHIQRLLPHIGKFIVQNPFTAIDRLL
jgi:hypothetical protein